jgi:hypothetical protein
MQLNEPQSLHVLSFCNQRFVILYNPQITLIIYRAVLISQFGKIRLRLSFDLRTP